MPFPFEVSFAEIEADPFIYVDEIFGALQSDFLTLPKGNGFIEYPVFEQGYEALKRTTKDFREVSAEPVVELIQRVPVAFIVLRTMLGFTPPEWAYVATQRSENTGIPQGAARALDRRIRMKPTTPLKIKGVSVERMRAMISAACDLLNEGVPVAERTPELLHRLDKADTRDGIRSVQPLADLGVPYAMLLYERFLGRPFAGHRDSVSELVGDVLETAIEGVLARGGITFRKTKRAERVTGFDQAPDFIIPNEFNPQVVIEAKITEDDGTARDKITRVLHLVELSRQGVNPNRAPRFEVVACIAGRGFKERREDMKNLIQGTRGKVFTLQTLSRLVECTRLNEFQTRQL